MKILTYTINGQKISQLNSFLQSDLNENLPYLLVENDYPTPANYLDDTSVEIIVRKRNMFNDYKCFHDLLKETNTNVGWTNLTNTEKDILIDYYAYINPTNAIIHLMTTKGLSQVAAQSLLLEKWQKHNKNFVYACYERFYYVKRCVLTYLNIVDGTTLLESNKLLIDYYTNEGLIGLGYGDNTNGIMDYVESTNAFINNGLAQSNYTLNFGTFSMFITALKDIIVYGKYTKLE